MWHIERRGSRHIRRNDFLSSIADFKATDGGGGSRARLSRFGWISRRIFFTTQQALLCTFVLQLPIHFWCYRPRFVPLPCKMAWEAERRFAKLHFLIIVWQNCIRSKKFRDLSWERLESLAQKSMAGPFGIASFNCVRHGSEGEFKIFRGKRNPFA